MNDLSFFDYGMVCFSLTLLGLLLTVLEFRKMSTRSNPVARTSRASHSPSRRWHRRDIRLAVAEGPSEPREGFLGLVAQRVDLGDFVGTTIGLPLDQSPSSRAAPAERAIAKPRVSTN